MARVLGVGPKCYSVFGWQEILILIFVLDKAISLVSEKMVNASMAFGSGLDSGVEIRRGGSSLFHMGGRVD